MDKEAKASPGEKRQWPRVKLDARVVVSYPNLEQLVSGPLSDISMGGLFIRTPAVRPVGTQLTIKVIARSETLEFEARGRVVRVVRPDDTGNDPGPTGPGMGVAFDSLDAAASAALARLIEAAVLMNRTAQ